MTLQDIEQLAKKYADARGLLSERVQDCQAEMEAVKRQALPGIKGALARAVVAHAQLVSAVEQHPELFEKPKTQIFHNIKVGYRKGKGKLEWEDDDVLVARIEKRFADQPELIEQLIIVKKKPSKAGLEELDAAELRRLGVTVEDAGDQVQVKPVDGAVEKLVNALLKDALDEAAA
ncbi:host-nuclease inhibitor Gam family protein [Candidatus Nitrospira bockiana]